MAAEAEAKAGPSQAQGEASSVNSDDVDSVVWSLLSDKESVTLEAEEDEYLSEIISIESDEEALAKWYMPPNEAGSAASVKVDDVRATVYRENRFLVKGSIPLYQGRQADGLSQAHLFKALEGEIFLGAGACRFAPAPPID